MRGQRDPVPFNRRPPRRDNSRGGPPPTLIRRTLQPDMDGEEARYSPTTNDGLIRHDHTPWYPMFHYGPAATGWVNWTACGPPRPELHMRTLEYRRMAGTSRTRFPVNPLDPKVGLHTDPSAAIPRTVPRFVGPNPQMTKPRQDRLAMGQYSGQSYSQTTIPQGDR